MDFNSARDCLFARWARESFMREGHFDTAHVVEPLGSNALSDVGRCRAPGKRPLDPANYSVFYGQ
jgi:hypothetical protein